MEFEIAGRFNPLTRTEGRPIGLRQFSRIGKAHATTWEVGFCSSPLSDCRPAGSWKIFARNLAGAILRDLSSGSLSQSRIGIDIMQQAAAAHRVSEMVVRRLIAQRILPNCKPSISSS